MPPRVLGAVRLAVAACCASLVRVVDADYVIGTSYADAECSGPIVMSLAQFGEPRS